MSEFYTSQNIKEVIENLVDASGAKTAILITKEGHNVTSAGDISYFNTTALAALVAGMFSATREVARLVGENQFSILLQQGEKRHIHISLVTDSVMMVLIFEDYKRIGIIRHEARKAGKRLCDLLTGREKTSSPPQQPEELTLSAFKEYALNIIDKIFEV